VTWCVGVFAKMQPPPGALPSTDSTPRLTFSYNRIASRLSGVLAKMDFPCMSSLQTIGRSSLGAPALSFVYLTIGHHRQFNAWL